MDGFSFRVPTPTVSVLDFVAVMKNKVKMEDLQKKFKQYARDDKFSGALEVTDEPLVSVDFKGNTAASIVDLNLIQVIDGDLVRIVAYYDNEMGYSSRMASLIKYIGEQIFV
jgi:glyceraldehyde 3-phosphate dehydrogenase